MDTESTAQVVVKETFDFTISQKFRVRYKRRKRLKDSRLTIELKDIEVKLEADKNLSS